MPSGHGWHHSHHLQNRELFNVRAQRFSYEKCADRHEDDLHQKKRKKGYSRQSAKQICMKKHAISNRHQINNLQLRNDGVFIPTFEYVERRRQRIEWTRRKREDSTHQSTNEPRQHAYSQLRNVHVHVIAGVPHLLFVFVYLCFFL